MTPDPAPVVELLLSRSPLLGRSRLVCIDGPAGSGKTTLAKLVAGECARRAVWAVLVHMDDLYEGWGGLAAAGERVNEAIVEPLGRGDQGSYRRYDWHREQSAEQVRVPPADVVVLEGVGSASLRYADRVSLLVFVEASETTRLNRWVARDGPALSRHWRPWAVEEAQLHTDERTRSRADLVVDGETGDLRVVGPADP